MIFSARQGDEKSVRWWTQSVVALDIAELLVAIELGKDSSWHRKNLGSSSDANGEFV